MSNLQEMLANGQPIVSEVGVHASETLSKESLGRPKKYDALLLDAQARQSLVATRSLGSRGLSVALLETENLAKHLPAFASRWCQEWR